MQEGTEDERRGRREGTGKNACPTLEEGAEWKLGAPRRRLDLARGEEVDGLFQKDAKQALDELRQSSNGFAMIFVHSKKFDKAAAKLFTEEELNALKEWLAQYPEGGDLIRGSGGCRKARWAAKGHGKSGEARVIYFYRTSAGVIMLLRLYAKNEAEDISQHTIQQLKKGVKTNE